MPDSIRYVPALRLLQVSAIAFPAATSVPNDCTRSGCIGGRNVGLPAEVGSPPGTVLVSGALAAGQVAPSGWCTGLVVVVPPPPRPPPTCPTITSEVGTELPLANISWFVRLIVRLLPGATVMTGGTHPPAGVARPVPVARAQLALVPASSQNRPHMGTVCPSGSVVCVGAAVRLTTACANATPPLRRRTEAATTDLSRRGLKVLDRIKVLLVLNSIRRSCRRADRTTSSSACRRGRCCWS